MPRRPYDPDYPLQDTPLDVSLQGVLNMPAAKRRLYIEQLVTALGKEVRANRMALKQRVPFKDEMRDLRRLLYKAPDEYLLLDEKTNKRNVLAIAAPGRSHAHWSRHEMWKM